MSNRNLVTVGCAGLFALPFIAIRLCVDRRKQFATLSFVGVTEFSLKCRIHYHVVSIAVILWRSARALLYSKSIVTCLPISPVANSYVGHIVS